MKRMQKLTPWFVVFVTAAVVAVSFGLVAGLVGLLVIASRPAAGTRAEQDRIVAAIQTFREQHGRLPDSLQEVGIEFDHNLFDSVGYSKATSNPNEFTLSCTKDYWNPTPRMHWWYYSSDRGTWEHETEGY